LVKSVTRRGKKRSSCPTNRGAGFGRKDDNHLEEKKTNPEWGMHTKKRILGLGPGKGKKKKTLR